MKLITKEVKFKIKIGILYRYIYNDRYLDTGAGIAYNNNLSRTFQEGEYIHEVDE